MQKHKMEFVIHNCNMRFVTEEMRTDLSASNFMDIAVGAIKKFIKYLPIFISIR